MVTIFDMVTGELIHDDSATCHTADSELARHENALLTPRLQTVEEAMAIERQQREMPADLLNTDIGSFVDSQ